MRKKGLVQIALACLLLLVGGALYLFLRPSGLLLHKVAADLGLGEQIRQGRLFFSGFQLPEWMLFSLPAALWAAAYILVTDAILAQRPPLRRLAVAAFIPALGMASELMQALHLLPGTFDVADLVAYAVPCLAYVMWLGFCRPRNTPIHSPYFLAL